MSSFCRNFISADMWPAQNFAPIISRWEGEGRKVGFHKLTKQHEQAQYRTARNLLLQASGQLEHYFSKENERTTNEEVELGHDSVSCNRAFE